MTPTTKCRTLLDKLGIGGLSIFISLAGVIIYSITTWNYRLILRNESLILGAPAPFVCVGGAIFLAVIFILWRISKAQNRRIGWGIREGRSRGGPLQWEDVLLCVIPGIILGTIGIALFINSYFDTSPERSHDTTITQMYTVSGSRSSRSYYLCLNDWKNPHSQITIAFDRQTFNTHHVRGQIIIKTKRGFLGYEWITDFK
jgi:hypothetical protein